MVRKVGRHPISCQFSAAIVRAERRVPACACCRNSAAVVSAHSRSAADTRELAGHLSREPFSVTILFLQAPLTSTTEVLLVGRTLFQIV